MLVTIFSQRWYIPQGGDFSFLLNNLGILPGCGFGRSRLSENFIHWVHVSTACRRQEESQGHTSIHQSARYWWDQVSTCVYLYKIDIYSTCSILFSYPSQVSFIYSIYPQNHKSQCLGGLYNLNSVGHPLSLENTKIQIYVDYKIKLANP